MRPVFANTAWVHTRAGLIRRGGGMGKVALPVRFGLFERRDGVVLIDTGYSPEALSAPGRSWGLRAYAHAFAPMLCPDGDPSAVLARLGFRPEDVRAVIVTHFHVDHIAALARFTKARLIAQGAVLARIAARGRGANLRRGIFPELIPAPMRARLDDIAACAPVDAPLGLGPAHDLFGDATVLAVALPGHAEGHFGLCFTGSPPFLYAADAGWQLAGLADPRPAPALRLIGDDPAAASASAARLARFAAAGGRVMLCHDPAPGLYDLAAPS